MTVHSAVAPEAQPATRVNPVTAAVIHGALENITIEMGHKLTRMAYSNIIHESEDFGAALTDAEGGQLCECKMSTPLQSGPIPGYIRGIRKELAKRGEAICPGDVIMHNDPYGALRTGRTSLFARRFFLMGSRSDSRSPPPIIWTSAPRLPAAQASSAPSTPMPKGCSSKRSRSSRTGGRTEPSDGSWPLRSLTTRRRILPLRSTTRARRPRTHIEASEARPPRRPGRRERSGRRRRC
jgi:hypothetical protein